jgi:hypothetical protein
MSSWDDKPDDYDHACKIIETLQAALEAQLEAHNYAEVLEIARKALAKEEK